eukprot:GHRR01001327.1.p1 GENE.GHRR01001327.1~~GHRR01001327.1.p1  ORF type:complete len:457 (+),score=134.36 GHRR01001327.1:109-1479(+)
MGLGDYLQNWLKWVVVRTAWLLSDLFGWRFALNLYPAVMRNKVAIVTGANSGLGLETTKALLQQGATVIMACRSLEKAHTSKAEILQDRCNHGPVGNAAQRLIPLHLDLEDFNSIKQFVSDFHALNLPLHLLVNNAGVHIVPYKRVSLGFERNMASNYFSPFWLTQQLLPDLQASAPSRVVNMASIGEAWGIFTGYTLPTLPFDDIPGYKLKDSGERPYAISKLFLVMGQTRELARRLEGTGVDVIAVHPGFVNTPWYLKTDPDAYLFSWIIHSIRSVIGSWVRVGQSPITGAISQIYASIEPSLTGSTSKPKSKGIVDSINRALFGGRLLYYGPSYLGIYFLQNWNNAGVTWAWNPWVYNKEACARLYDASMRLLQQVEQQLPVVSEGQTLQQLLPQQTEELPSSQKQRTYASVLAATPQAGANTAVPFANGTSKAQDRLAGVAQAPQGADQSVY